MDEREGMVGLGPVCMHLEPSSRREHIVFILIQCGDDDEDDDDNDDGDDGYDYVDDDSGSDARMHILRDF